MDQHYKEKIEKEKQRRIAKKELKKTKAEEARRLELEELSKIKEENSNATYISDVVFF